MPDPTPAEPWYAEGLRFECTGCGRCCTGDGGYVWVGLDEIRALATRLGLGLDDFGRRYLRRVGSRYALVNDREGSCVFLAGRSCTVYEDRPSQCRAFPWWPANLVSWKHWAFAASRCEGISHDAPLVHREVIEAGLAAARAAGLREPGDTGAVVEPVQAGPAGADPEAARSVSRDAGSGDGRPDDENVR